jgi:hypothetical protein
LLSPDKCLPGPRRGPTGGSGTFDGARRARDKTATPEAAAPLTSHGQRGHPTKRAPTRRRSTVTARSSPSCTARPCTFGESGTPG